MARQSSSRVSTAATVSEIVSPSKREAAGQHLEQHDAERPDIRAPVDRLAARLLGRHVGCRPEDHAHPVIAAGLAIVAVERVVATVLRWRAAAVATGGSSALARPKSSTFTVPSDRSLMFAGLRSRWTMPASCAASRASAICRAIGSASSTGMAPRVKRCGQVLAFDELHDERRGCRPHARSRRPGQCAGGSVTRASSPRARTGQSIRVRRHRRGQDLDRDRPPERRVAGAIHLAHAASAEQRDDFIGAETGPGVEAHEAGRTRHDNTSATAHDVCSHQCELTEV